MERKNYLLQELSKDEKGFLKTIIINERRSYIKENYNYINCKKIDLYKLINVEDESVLEIVLNRCEEEIKSAIEFEKVTSDDELYIAIKALSLKEKMVLFSLYKKNKELNQIAKEMKIDRITVWRIKNRALDKIMKSLLGGNRNV